MSTEIATFVDSMNSAIELQVYSGSGGICLFVDAPQSKIKFWLKLEDAAELADQLEVLANAKK